MIVLKISNASEVVASKIGKFLERLTPDGMDQHMVEQEVVKQLMLHLRAEGLQGEVAVVSGADLKDGDLQLHDGMKIQRHDHF